MPSDRPEALTVLAVRATTLHHGKSMIISEGGQITIPRELRERYGFLPNTEVEFHARNGALELRKKKGSVREAVRRSYGKTQLGTGTDELMKLLKP